MHLGGQTWARLNTKLSTVVDSDISILYYQVWLYELRPDQMSVVNIILLDSRSSSLFRLFDSTEDVPLDNPFFRFFSCNIHKPSTQSVGGLHDRLMTYFSSHIAAA